MKNNDFSAKIIDWFRVNCRDLPWRNTTDPYFVWVSEIILQQTRVAQGLAYYNRFVERFPNVRSLAESDENEVLRYWQGLGYYSRARNLHTAARQIVERHGGIFPQCYEEVLALKGVGEYTAAAICSFAYNQPYAVLDGNVYRVLARVFGIETPINQPRAKKEFTALAQILLDKNEPAIHNQAIMEFGALQCTPASPDCATCVLLEKCAAFGSKKVEILPVKEKKMTVKERFFNYFFVQNGDFIYLKKREKNDIWKNLYELPLIETAGKIELSDLIDTQEFNSVFGEKNLQISSQEFAVKHILTHRIIYAVFYTVAMQNNEDLPPSYLKIPKAKLADFPVSRLIEMFLENI